MEHCRDPCGLTGRPDQSHARFFGRSASFPVVALQAAGHDVFPGLSSAFDDGNHVVECQILSPMPAAAILACVLVPRINVCPAELYMMEPLAHLDIPEEAQDARHLDREAYTPDLTVVLGDYLDFALKEKGQRLPPGDDVDRFVSRIQNKSLFHLLLP